MRRLVQDISNLLAQNPINTVMMVLELSGLSENGIDTQCRSRNLTFVNKTSSTLESKGERNQPRVVGVTATQKGQKRGGELESTKCTGGEISLPPIRGNAGRVTGHVGCPRCYSSLTQPFRAR